MNTKEFNKSLSKYLDNRTNYGKNITLSDIKAKIMPNFEKIKIKPKFKETEIEFIEHDKLCDVEPRKGFFARLFSFKRKEKSNVVDEEMNPVSEEQALQQSKDFEIQVETDANEFDKELDEIEQVENEQRKRFHFLRSLISRLKFKNRILKQEKETIEEEAEFYEEQQGDIKEDLKTVLDFSIDILKLLPSKDFQWLKEKDSFQSYKHIIRKYMPAIKKDSEKNIN